MNVVFGLDVFERNGLKCIEQGGAWGGFRSLIRIYPKKKFGIILLANVSSIFPPNYVKKIENIFLSKNIKKEIKSEQGIFKKTTVKLPIDLLNKYTGDYFVKNWCTLWKLTTEKNKLVFGSPSRIFEPVNNTEFISVKPTPPGRSLKIYKDKNNEYSLIYSTGSSNFIFNKIQSFKPDKKKLLNYCGKYYSEELDVEYKFSIEKRKLKLHSVKDFDGLLLTSSSKDSFYNTSWRVSLLLNETKKGS